MDVGHYPPAERRHALEGGDVLGGGDDDGEVLVEADSSRARVVERSRRRPSCDDGISGRFRRAYKPFGRTGGMAVDEKYDMWGGAGGTLREGRREHHVGVVIAHVVLQPVAALRAEVGYERVKLGQRVTVPETPVKEGYEFGGWFTDSACTERYDFNNGVTGHTTLYAKWTPASGSGDAGGDSGKGEGNEDGSDDSEHTIEFDWKILGLLIGGLIVIGLLRRK